MATVVEINDAIRDFASGPILSIALVLAAAGSMAMAILQIIKEITPIRQWFHRAKLLGWIRVRQGDETVLDGLVELATGGDAKAFFDLAAEQLVGQINAASQIAVDYPHQHERLLRVLAAGASEADFDMVIGNGGKVPADSSIAADFHDARNRIGHRIQRNLDGLQISVSARWRWWMQTVSIVITAALIQVALVAALQRNNIEYGWFSWTMLLSLLLGIAGGYLAPIARDLVAALQNMRK